MSDAENAPGERGGAVADGDGDSRDPDGPVGVLEAPVETAEPLHETVEVRECRVLKADLVDRLTGLSEAIERAEQRADRLVEEARREADAIRREARETGRREGYEELVEEIARVRERYRTIQDEAERDTLELAFRVAEQIVGRTIEQDPAVVRRMVAESLEHVRGKRHVVVHVHPDDLAELAPHREAMGEELDGATIYFEEDDRLERGGCLIETEATRVDARLEMQLQTLEEAIIGETRS